MEEKYNG